MARFWPSLKKSAPAPYKLARLVDSRQREETGKGGVHIICDIDKTYLETEFESVIRMARIAFEVASDKVTVSGASEVLQLARWGSLTAALPAGGEYPRCLHFVSSSPPQLRSVLAEKMMMDGLDWSSDTFKNQAYNIRMGRMDLLRQHVAYKSLAILTVVASAGPEARFTLIGDNAESDAYIYAGIKLLLDGRLSEAAYRSYLELAGVESGTAAELASGLPAQRGARVDSVLIRNVPGYELAEAPPLTDLVQTFDNFFQAALLLIVGGVLGEEHLWPLVRSFHNHYGIRQRQLGALLTILAETPGVAPAIAAAAASARSHLHRPTGPQERPAAFVRSLELDHVQLGQLSETEILGYARLWQARLAAAKAKREVKDH